MTVINMLNKKIFYHPPPICNSIVEAMFPIAATQIQILSP